MIQRNGNAELVVLGQPHRLADEIAIVEDVMMGQCSALRGTRSARSKLNVYRVIELYHVSEFGEARALIGTRHIVYVPERDRARNRPVADLNHYLESGQTRGCKPSRLRGAQFR